jgi:PAS domain-containing protein
MDKEVLEGSLDDILNATSAESSMPFSIKDTKGKYIFANDAWGELAEVSPHTIIGRRDNQLPWGSVHTDLVMMMDAETVARGTFYITDRRPHFRGDVWLRTSTEKFFVPAHDIIVSRVDASTSDEFCELATRMTEKGITHNGISLSVKQLYLLHQHLFHVPHKQSAREIGCSTNRIHQYLRDIRDKFEAEDSKELMCALSANGFFTLLEHFDLLFKHTWLPSELRFH